MRRIKGSSCPAGGALAGLILLAGLVPGPPARAQIDCSRYMSPNELRPGMKGHGRTVISGTKVETFQIEVLGVMHNDYLFYADQDVILVRCSGLDLERTGVIGGMSGSPCYVRDEKTGEDRLIGAVAYSWSFNKDPVCGVQPITQMLPIREFRHPRKRPADAGGQASAGGKNASRRAAGAGVPIGEIISKVCTEPIPEASRFSIFNKDLAKARESQPRGDEPAGRVDQLCPLVTPVMVSGASERTVARLRDRFEPFGLMPVVSGGASRAARAAADNVKLEPGSVLCVTLMAGDLTFDALGTCTEVDGDRILGFGHSLLGEGSVELPLATGTIHTVLASIARSNKIGASLKTVGTLWGDENSGIFGIRGTPPPMLPLDVVVHDIRGQRSYHYDIAYQEILTSLLMQTGVMESIYAHHQPPREHTIRYAIETEFQRLGTYRTTNLTSQGGVFGLRSDLSIPTTALMTAQFGKARPTRARVEVTIDEGARSGGIAQVTLPRTVFKPGETVTAQVRWFHYRSRPAFTQASYALALPQDIPDGQYELTVGSARAHLAALRSEKPHLFRAESLEEMLEAFNFIASFPDNRLYMRLQLPTGGMAVKRMEMPELPSFRRKILSDAGRTDVQEYSDALIVQHETEFAVSGASSLKIRVSRRADQ